MNKKQYAAQGQATTILRELDGHCMTQIEGQNSMLEFWQVHGRVIIIQLWDVGGWEYYLQGRENHLDKIPAAIVDYLQ